MIDMAHAPADRRLDLIESSVRMTGVATNAVLTTGADERLRSRQLRGDGGCSDNVSVFEKGQEISRLGSADRRSRMTAAGFRSKIRAVEMRAKNGRTAGALRFQMTTNFKEGEMLLVPGHSGCRQQAGRAVARMGLADGAESLRRAVHEITAGTAVDM